MSASSASTLPKEAVILRHLAFGDLDVDSVVSAGGSATPVLSAAAAAVFTRPGSDGILQRSTSVKDGLSQDARRTLPCVCGTLEKQGGSRKSARGWKKRFFVLRENSVDLFYFPSARCDKLSGQFALEPGQTQLSFPEGDEGWGKQKKPFTIILSGGSLKAPRILAAESEAERERWRKALEHVLRIDPAVDLPRRTAGVLMKQGPVSKGGKWQKRFVLVVGPRIEYYRSVKDAYSGKDAKAPAGVILLSECSECKAAPDVKPKAFAVNHKDRVFHFDCPDGDAQARRFIDAINATIRGKTSSAHSRRSSWRGAKQKQVNDLATMRNAVPREKFLSKPIKEGVLAKLKTAGQFTKTKPIKLVLTADFLYYFPSVNNTVKYHTIQLADVKVEEIPEGMGKATAYSFRIDCSLHPLYLGAEEEGEWNKWMRTIEAASERCCYNQKSKTDSGIRTFGTVDYQVSIDGARSTPQGKVFDLRVDAFWTSRVLPKTYSDFMNLFKDLESDFPSHIFPEMSASPLNVDPDDASEGSIERAMSSDSDEIAKRRKRGSIRFNPLSSSRSKKITADVPENFDLEFLQCLMRELVRNFEVAQADTMVEFLDLDSIFSAVKTGEIAFVRYFVETAKEYEKLRMREELATVSDNADCRKVTGSSRVNVSLSELFEQYDQTSTSGRACTPLMLAVANNYPQIVEFLVKEGADINIANGFGDSALTLAAENGFVECLEIMMRLSGSKVDQSIVLIRLQATENDQVDFSDKIAYERVSKDSGSALIHVCAQSTAAKEDVATSKTSAVSTLPVLGYLLEHGANINQTDSSGRTALHRAILGGNTEFVSELLANGATLETADEDGFTAFLSACWRSHLEIAELLLLRGVNGLAADSQGRTALHLIVLRKSEPLLRLLIEHARGVPMGESNLLAHLFAAKTNVGSTAMHMATQLDFAPFIEAAIAENADLTLTDDNGHTVLHVAAIYGRDKIGQLFLKAKTGDGASLREQVISAQDYQGRTALHLALVAAGNGCFLEDTSHCIDSPVSNAAISALSGAGGASSTSEAGFAASAMPRILLSCGAPVDRLDSLLDESVLHYAIRSRVAALCDVLLRRSGAEAPGQYPSQDTETPRSSLNIVRLANRLGDTPLHLAAESGELEMVKILLSSEVDVNAQNFDGNTPLHVALHPPTTNPTRPTGLHAPNNPPVSEETRGEIASILCQKGASTVVANSAGMSPLAFASPKLQQQLSYVSMRAV